MLCRLALVPFLLAVLSACTSETAVGQVNELVLLDDTSEAAECEEMQPPAVAASCYRAMISPFDWEIVIYYERGITGANEVYVPDAVNVLESIVADCRLGRTILSYNTDGVASLFVGSGGLSDIQQTCIRSYERPGLYLQEAPNF
jgi:hypothetical protein